MATSIPTGIDIDPRTGLIPSALDVATLKSTPPAPAPGPTLTPTQVKLADAKSRLDNEGWPYRGIYHTTIGARRFLSELRAAAISLAQGQVSSGYYDAVNIATNQSAKLAGAIALLDTLESSAEFKAAVEVIEPLQAAFDALAALDLKERLDRAAKESAYALAVEKVRQAALATVESHPDVVAAAAALK